MNTHTARDLITSLMVSEHGRFFHGRVLDIDCGSKPFKRLFFDGKEYRAPVTEWVGIDERGRGEIVGTISDVDDGSFDTILCVHALCRMKDPALAIREFYRVLTPGGTLLCVEPNTDVEDESTFWNFKAQGLGMLAFDNGFGDNHEAKTASRLWQANFDNFRSESKFGYPLPAETQRFVAHLEQAYPHVTVLIATKKE